MSGLIDASTGLREGTGLQFQSQIGTVSLNIIQAATNLPLGPTLLVAQGDSISAGYGTTGYTSTPPRSSHGYPNLYANPYPGRVTFYNYAQSGYNMALMAAQASTIDGLLTANPTVTAKILSIMIGTNDTSNATYYPSGEAAWLTDFFTYTDARKAAGWTVLAGSIIAAGDRPQGPFDAWRFSLASSLLASVGTHIDGFFDFANSHPMGDYATTSNLTYFQADTVHPTDAGDAILELLYAPAINPKTVALSSYSPFTAWNPSDAGAGIAFSNANRTAGGTTSFPTVRSTAVRDTGKWYTEFVFSGSNNAFVGLCDKRSATNTYIGQAVRSIGLWSGNGTAWIPTAVTTGNQIVNTFTTVNSFPCGTITSTSVVGMAIDFDAGNVWFHLNGTYPGSGNPATGTNPGYTFDPNSALYLATSPNDAAAFVTLPANAGQIQYPVPSGYGYF